MPAGLIEQEGGMGAGATVRENFARCRAMAAVLQDGGMRSAAFPRAGQMAPTIQV
jgi:hypothetical protein